MEDSRIVRDLLDANLRLTEQVCEMARLAIGAPTRATLTGAPMEAIHEPAPSTEEFGITTADDWEDIPPGSADDIEVAAALAEAATDPRILHLVQPRTDPNLKLPGYMTEEEEDLRWQVAMGQEAPAKLAELLTKLGVPSSEMTMTLA